MVHTGTYDYGFSLNLLLKDMGIGVGLVRDVGLQTDVLGQLKETIEGEIDGHLSEEEMARVDHLYISKIFENKNQMDLRPIDRNDEK